MKNKNNIVFFSIVSICFLLISCGKRPNTKLARDYYKLALLELSSRDQNDQLSYKKALGYINQAIEQDTQARYVAARGTILFLLGQESSGIESFQKALGLCGKDEALRAEIMNNYACAYAQQNKSDQALKIWQDLETNQYYLTPEVSFVNQGKLYADNGDLNKARACMLKAVTLCPSYVDAHYYTALIAQRMGDVALAKNELKTLLFLEPGHVGAAQLMTHIDKIGAREKSSILQ